ncbi:MAG: glycosyltransferase family 87 protein [Chloroflexota bacterium]
MSTTLGASRAVTGRAPVPRLAAWLLLGAIGWGWVVALGAGMLATRPPTAGFDLELLLDAGRRVAVGQSPYDSALIGGAAVDARSLFYSYPPPVAQAMAVVAALPSALVLVAWALAAAAAFGFVAAAIARRLGRREPRIEIAVAVLAVAPFVFPYAVGLLFGNLDVWFPALYGLMLLGALAPSGAPATSAGVALGVVAIAKLHPASLGVWFLARGSRERRIAAVAALTVGGIVAASLLAGGFGPWTDYMSVVRAGTAADIVDARNAGPAAIVALTFGLGAAQVRVVQAVVSLAAIAVTLWAARTRRDPVESLAWAAAASLVTLPVTWYHYPAALLPFAVAAIARAPLAGSAAMRRTTFLAAAAIVGGIVAIAATPLIWLAIGLVLAATRASAPRTGSEPRLAEPRRRPA